MNLSAMPDELAWVLEKWNPNRNSDPGLVI